MVSSQALRSVTRFSKKQKTMEPELKWWRKCSNSVRCLWAPPLYWPSAWASPRLCFFWARMGSKSWFHELQCVEHLNDLLKINERPSWIEHGWRLISPAAVTGLLPPACTFVLIFLCVLCLKKKTKPASLPQEDQWVCDLGSPNSTLTAGHWAKSCFGGNVIQKLSFISTGLFFFLQLSEGNYQLHSK